MGRTSCLGRRTAILEPSNRKGRSTVAGRRSGRSAGFSQPTALNGSTVRGAASGLQRHRLALAAEADRDHRGIGMATVKPASSSNSTVFGMAAEIAAGEMGAVVEPFDLDPARGGLHLGIDARDHFPGRFPYRRPSCRCSYFVLFIPAVKLVHRQNWRRRQSFARDGAGAGRSGTCRTLPKPRRFGYRYVSLIRIRRLEWSRPDAPAE